MRVLRATLLIVSALIAPALRAGVDPKVGPESRSFAGEKALSQEDIASVIRRPISTSDLLINLKVGWEKRLLVQQAFWSSATIKTFFDAGKITRNHQRDRLMGGWPTGPDLTLWDRLAYSHLLHDPIELFTSRYYPPLEKASWVYPYPRHTEYVGSISFELAVDAGITWADVKSVFGSDAINIGPPPLPVSDSRSGGYDSKSGLQRGSSQSQETHLTMCYRRPMPPASLIPILQADGVIDGACFSLQHVPYWKKGAIIAINPNPREWLLPHDNDVVIRIRLQEHQGHIPLYCYPLKIDPALVVWCPARAAPRNASK